MFRITVGVRQGCLLSLAGFNIFLKRNIYEALDDHEGSVSIRGRLITNFHPADDIVVTDEEKEDPDVLVGRLDTTTEAKEIEIGPDKNGLAGKDKNDNKQSKRSEAEAVEKF